MVEQTLEVNETENGLNVNGLSDIFDPGVGEKGWTAMTLGCGRLLLRYSNKWEFRALHYPNVLELSLWSL